MSSWVARVECWVDNGPRSVAVLSLTRRLSGETGTPGISCASRLGEVRIRIISQQDCGGVLRVSTATASAPSR